MSDDHCNACGHLYCICDQQLKAMRKERSDRAMKVSAEALKRLKDVLAKRPTCLSCNCELVAVSKTTYECLHCGTCFFKRTPVVSEDWLVQVKRPPQQIHVRFTA